MKDWFTSEFDGMGATMAALAIIITLGIIFGTMALSMVARRGCP